MDLSLKEILQFAVNGGTSALLLIIWYVTQTRSAKQTETAIEVANKAVDAANSTSKEAFAKQEKIMEALLQHIRDEQDERTLMTGVLDRLSIRLETPISCPLAVAGKKFRVEVDG